MLSSASTHGADGQKSHHSPRRPPVAQFLVEEAACPGQPWRARGLPQRHLTARCQKGYGHLLHTVLGTQGFDDFRGPSIGPLAVFLLLVAHGDLDATKYFGRKDGRDTAQAERGEAVLAQAVQSQGWGAGPQCSSLKHTINPETTGCRDKGRWLQGGTGPWGHECHAPSACFATRWSLQAPRCQAQMAGVGSHMRSWALAAPYVVSRHRLATYREGNTRCGG